MVLKNFGIEGEASEGCVSLKNAIRPMRGSVDLEEFKVQCRASAFKLVWIGFGASVYLNRCVSGA